MNEGKKIAAGIVLYNPDDVKRVNRCIESILVQVDKIYIFDNNIKPINIDFNENVTYITENKNLGIAYALNRIMEKAAKDGYEWVITMDQDSILPFGIVSAYEEVINKYEDLGIICPQVVDARRIYMEKIIDPKEEFIEFCITSASCTNIRIWEKVGKFDDWLFVDLVDNDFCKRLISSGYKILRLNEYVLDQEFGKIIPKSPRKQIFWFNLSRLLKNVNVAKFSYKKYVSPLRVYYTTRNIIYVNRKLRKYGSVAYKDNYNCKGYIGFWVCFCLPSFLRAQDKWSVFKAIFKGTYDGRNMEVEEWEVSE